MNHLPHSAASEQALLGILMQDPTEYPTIRDAVSPEDFYIPLHAEVYRSIGRLVEQKMEPSPIVIAERLPSEFGTPAELRGFFSELMNNASLGNDAYTFGSVILQYSHQRQIIGTAERLALAARANNVTDMQVLQRKLSELHAMAKVNKPETPLEQAQGAFKAACQTNSMLQTGILAWDKTLGGIFPGSRYIIAGHGGAGKSALAVNIAWNMALDGKRVRWLSYEEKPEALWWRIMAREAMVPITSFRYGLTQRQQVTVHERAGRVFQYDFKAFYGVQTVPQMIAECGPCDLIVLDGMTTAPAPGGDTMVDNAGIVTRYCATLAERTGAAVIILAHINSDAVKNGATMAGIYGGQAATFDPEAIVEVRRADMEDKMPGPKRINLSVIKNRYGESGVKKELVFNGEYMKFTDVVG